MSDEKTSELTAEEQAALVAAAPVAEAMAAAAPKPPAALVAPDVPDRTIGTSAAVPVLGSGSPGADVAALGGLKPAMDGEEPAVVDPDIYTNPAGQKFRINRHGSVGVSAVAVK